MTSRTDPGGGWTLASLILGGLAVAVWYMVPIDSGRTIVEKHANLQTLLWFPLLFPLLSLAVRDLRARFGLRLLFGALALMYVMVTGASIGVAYLPSVIVLLIGAARSGSKDARVSQSR